MPEEVPAQALNGQKILLLQMPRFPQLWHNFGIPDAVKLGPCRVHLLVVMPVLFGGHKRVACFSSGHEIPILQNGFPGRPCPYSMEMQRNSPDLARSKSFTSSSTLAALRLVGFSQCVAGNAVSSPHFRQGIRVIGSIF